MVSLRSIGIDNQQPIINFAVKNAEFLYDKDTIHRAVERILGTGYRRFPIVRKKRMLTRVRNELVGIITVTDILDAFLRGVDFEKPISEIMTRDVVYCYPDDSLQVVLRKFQFSRRGGFPVVNKHKELMGIITEHDLAVLLKGHDFKKPISDIMTKKPFFIKPISFKEALSIFVNTRYRKIPVVENKKVIGLMTDRLCLSLISRSRHARHELNFPIREVILKNIYTVKSEDDISKAIDMMASYRIGGLLVAEHGELKGIVTERDIFEEIIA